MPNRESYITKVERPHEILEAIKDRRTLVAYVEATKEHRDLMNWVRNECSPEAYRVFSLVNENYVTSGYDSIDDTHQQTLKSMLEYVRSTAYYNKINLSTVEAARLVEVLTLSAVRVRSLVANALKNKYGLASTSYWDRRIPVNLQDIHRDNSYYRAPKGMRHYVRILDTRVGPSTEFARDQRGSGLVVPEHGAIAVIKTGPRGAWHRAPTETTEGGAVPGQRRGLATVWLEPKR